MTAKNLFLILIFAAGCLTANAQNLKDSDVPSAVKTKFSSMYPNATGVKWEKENNEYGAAFKNNSAETEVIFDASGNHVQTEIDISVSSLPQSINDYVTKTLKGQSISEATKITSAAGTVTYEAKVGATDYIFTDNGSFVKKETDDPNDTDDSK